MNISAYILCFQEHEILPYVLRHYRTFCDRIVVHDMGSTDGSQQIVIDAGAELVQQDCKGEFDDRLNQGIKNTCWQSRATDDWAVIADADEFIYFPAGVALTLSSYELQNLAVVHPHGYEMLDDKYPSGSGQIYDEVKMGSKEVAWYSKPILVSPKRLARLEYSTGAHTVTAHLKTGRQVRVDQKSPFDCPSCLLLHNHHLGGVERIGRLYQENRDRQSAANRANRWGLQEAGATHAQRKRDAILPKLERVIP